jgi:hypothetical protein
MKHCRFVQLCTDAVPLSAAIFYHERQNPVSAASDSAKDEEEQGAERQATSMRDQLSKEVASWTKQRRQQPDEIVGVPKQPIPERHPRVSASDAKKTNVSSATVKPSGARSGPFSMSYDGQSQAEYIKHLLDRGTR